MEQLRSEYPRMQFRRADYQILNGAWTYEFDFGLSGLDRSRQKAGAFAQTINVPFAPESPLSGVGYRDFIPAMFYQRDLTIPKTWQGRKILLHFGAVDYEAVVFINGEEAGRHYGSSGSFTIDLTGKVQPGESCSCVVYVRDDQRSGLYGVGKQSYCYQSTGCFYTRTTGIWQTVFMEPVAASGLKSCKITPDLDGGRLLFAPEFYQGDLERTFKITVKAAGKTVGSLVAGQVADGQSLIVELSDIKPWSPVSPFLYEVVYEVFKGDRLLDRVESYAALRKTAIVGNKFYLNNQPLFLRLVLDQGFYPDGTWTAPDDAALKQDIEMSQAAGFNGARLHQKVFEDRYYYWADKLGYLTWSEFPSWGMHWDKSETRYNFLTEWTEVMGQLGNHPSIVAWTPLNETCMFDHDALERQFRGDRKLVEEYRRFVTAVYDVTKLLDPTRPVNDASGFLHVKTDLWTVHPYKKDAADLDEFMTPADGGAPTHVPGIERGYCGQPIVVDEFGGFKFILPERRKADDDGWGYNGISIETPEELRDRILDQTKYMVERGDIAGYCYTQLTDVEQEQNGVFCYDRTPKAPLAMLREAFGIKPDWSAE